MKKKTASTTKPWTAMTTAELDQATRGLENLRFEDTRPLNAREQEQWERARRGRPRKAIKAARVLISIEPAILARADALAKARGVSRSQLFVRGVSSLLAR